MALAHEEALSRKVEVECVRGLFADLGYPASLATLAALWRPDEAPLAIVVEQIAALAGRTSDLPPRLVTEAQTERARLDELSSRRLNETPRSDRRLDPDELPFRLDLACNRCGRVGQYIVERVTVHPDREKCQREGWDGYAFSQIIVCKYCGAEDDYVLTQAADRALTLHAFMALAWLGENPSREALPAGERTRLERWAQAMASWFVRASSCVEGRNGMLALRYHHGHAIPPPMLKALTVLHNFVTLRDDGTTAAERFIGSKPGDLFEHLVAVLPWLPRPRRRNGPARPRRHGTAVRVAQLGGWPLGVARALAELCVLVPPPARPRLDGRCTESSVATRSSPSLSPSHTSRSPTDRTEKRDRCPRGGIRRPISCPPEAVDGREPLQ